MSLQVNPNQICFPSQEAIAAYYNNHPLKTTGSLDSQGVTSLAPNAIEKISRYFANKMMSRTEVKYELEKALTNLEKAKLAHLIACLGNYITSCEKIDQGEPNSFTKDMKRIKEDAEANAKEPDIAFDIVITLHEHVLHDLIDNATYIPPKEGETKWTRQVADLTTQETSSRQVKDKNYV